MKVWLPLCCDAKLPQNENRLLYMYMYMYMYMYVLFCAFVVLLKYQVLNFVF